MSPIPQKPADNHSREKKGYKYEQISFRENTTQGLYTTEIQVLFDCKLIPGRIIAENPLQEHLKWNKELMMDFVQNASNICSILSLSII